MALSTQNWEKRRQFVQWACRHGNTWDISRFFEDTPHALTKRTNKQTNNEINEEGLKKVTTLTVWAIITKSPITFKRRAALVKTWNFALSDKSEINSEIFEIIVKIKLQYVYMSLPGYRKRKQMKMQVGMGFVSMYFSPMRVINFLCEAFACICNRKIVWSRNALPLHSLSLRNENYLMHFFVSIHTSRCFVSVWFNSKRRDHLPPSPVTFQLSGIYCQTSTRSDIELFRSDKKRSKPGSSAGERRIIETEVSRLLD